ncbi:cytochrome c [Halomonas sp. Y3]|uniref:c-type cytochrome n=1 Tax=Halomonas sp. Y3 TaxID=2956797 RepID=UPI00209EB3C6|nr:cytochrome c [Halomonas sp. Y3]
MLPSARFLICLSLLLPLAAVAGDGEASPDAERLDAERLETLLYQDCGSCHGMTLRGGLGPALPRDRMQALSPKALTHIIRHGIPGTAMPGWEALLSEAEARWIADHLQTDNRLTSLDD